MARGLADFDPEALRRHRHAAARRLGTPARLSAEDLAGRVGTTKAQIMAYERGVQTPDPKRIRQLAGALGTHPKELSRTPDFEYTSLGDLRRACGRTAEEVTEHLGVSPKVYRRFETSGIVPARRPALIDQVAAYLEVPAIEVVAALAESSATKERLAQMKVLLATMRYRYVEDPSPWQPPTPDDPDILELARLLGRSATSLARLLRHLFATLRNRYLRIQLNMVTATFETDPGRRKRAQDQVLAVNERYIRESDRLAQRLDRFFRGALPSDACQALARLIQADSWLDGPSLTSVPQTLSVLPSRFVIHRDSTVSGGREYHATDLGRQHIRNYATWYKALYPSIDLGDVPARHRFKTLAT